MFNSTPGDARLKVVSAYVAPSMQELSAQQTARRSLRWRELLAAARMTLRVMSLIFLQFG